MKRLIAVLGAVLFAGAALAQETIKIGLDG